MKILQVIHDFLPRHQAGSELYCYHLSKALQSLGHEVVLFFSEIDHARSSYAMRRDSYDGLPFWEMVNNHAQTAFRETYQNANADSRFEQCLREFRPDIVHFHHLLGLSYGFVRLCTERQIPTVFTLHDYWLTCPRGGGQRYRGENLLCHEVDPSLCAKCISRYSFGIPRVIRWTKRLLSHWENGAPGDLLPLLARGRVEAPRRRFVSRGQCEIEGTVREVLYAHPPSCVSVSLEIPESASLMISVAMTPSTYDQRGGGVRFRIVCDGEPLWENSLMSKQNPADRGWHTVRVSLEAWRGKRKLEFHTEAVPDGDIDFCSACWGEPKIIVEKDTAYRLSVQSRFHRWAENSLFFLQHRSLRKKVEARTRATHDLFNQASLFIAPSPFLRTKFIEYGLDPAKIVYSDYGIESKGYVSASRRSDEPIRFTYIGTLVEHKGLHVLIEAFNCLPDSLAVLNVYGDIREFSDYVQRIQAMISHPGIHLRGRAENTDIARILEETDVLVVPSIWFENSPITIHEAFLAGVPVIASRFGGMADLVEDGKNGLLFTLGNVVSLHECLKRCVENPSLIESLRPHSSSVKSIQSDAQWMEKTYKQLLDGKLIEMSI